MLEVLEIKADNNTVRIVELENRKISITDDIAQLKLDSALFMTIKDHIDYVVADATLKVKCDLTSTGIINGHQLNLAYGDYYIKSIPTVGDMGYIFLIGSDINDIVLLEWNPLDNTLNIKSSFITLDGDVNITGTTYLNKLKFGNQLDPITGVTYSFGSTINDNTIPTTLKVQNMINASQFDPNNSTLTGTTNVNQISVGGFSPNSYFININGLNNIPALNFKGQSTNITGVTYSFGSIINDNTIPTTQKVQNMIDAVSQFNPNDSTLTGTTTLSNIKFPTGSTINGFVNSTQNLNNDNTVPTSLRVKNMIDAIPLFNPNNLTLTGTTVLNAFKFATGNTMNAITISSQNTYNDTSLITSLKVKNLVDAVPVFNTNNSTLTGLTTINEGNIGGIIMKGTNMSNVWDIKMANQTNHFNRFYISTENIYDDLSILSSLKIKNMIDAIPVFNPNNLSLTGTTTLNTFKFATGASISGIIDSTQNIYNDTTVPTSLKVKNMIDAAPIFNPNNTNLTGQATINSALFGGRVVIGSTGIYSLPGIRFYGQTNWINTFEASGSTTINNSSVPSTARVKQMIDAIPTFNPNNSVLTGTTSVEEIDINGVIINNVTNTNSETYTDNHLITALKVQEMIDAIPTFNPNNLTLTGITKVNQIDVGGPIPAPYLITPSGISSLPALSFRNQSTNITGVSYSFSSNVDDNTLATSKRAQNLAFPIGIIVKFISTQSISTLPGTWTRVGIWGTKSPIVLYSITIRTIYLGNTARVTFIPLNGSTAASRTITFDQMGIINGATFYSDDFELVATNEYSFHDNQTKMTYSTNQFTVDRNNARSWSVTFSFDPVSTYSYASSVQYEYQRTA